MHATILGGLYGVRAGVMRVEVAVNEGINIRVSILGEWMRYLADANDTCRQESQHHFPSCDRAQVLG